MSNDTQVLRATLETALARIEDMLADDDGQAFKEARKFLESARQLAEQPVASHGLAATDFASQKSANVSHNEQAASPTAPSTEASEPVRWAMCTETETPCSTCPTLRIPCEASTERRRDLGDLIFALDQWKAAPPGNRSTIALDRLEAVIAALATPPPAPVLSDAEIDAIGFEQWGNQIGAMKAAYRAYARAIEQAVLRGGDK